MRTIPRTSTDLAVFLLAVGSLFTAATPARADRFIDRAVQVGQQGKHDEAIRLYTLAIERDHLNKNDLAVAYYNRGLAWAKKGQYDKAMADFDQLIQIEPGDASAYYNRGNVWLTKGEYNKAIADYSRAIQRKPDYVSAYNNRGIAWGKKGKYDKAMADYDRAILHKPDCEAPYIGRGDIWLAKDEYDKAIAEYSRAIQLRPDGGGAYASRGNAWRRKGEYDKAIADYSRAIKLNPKDARLHHRRGTTWLMKGEYDKGIADYSQAIKLNPKYARLYCDRGMACFLLWRFADAARDLRRCLALQPSDEYAAMWLYLVRRRARQDADGELAAFARQHVKDRSAWPGPVFEMFLGRLSPEQCLRAAEPERPNLSDPSLSASEKAARQTRFETLRRQQLCEAYFYVGQYQLIQGKTDEAKRLLQKCLATNLAGFVEYTGAQAELRRMAEKAQR